MRHIMIQADWEFMCVDSIHSSSNRDKLADVIRQPTPDNLVSMCTVKVLSMVDRQLYETNIGTIVSGADKLN